MLTEEVIAVGKAAGLDAVGVASAAPFIQTRSHLEERKEAGLHGGMAFTYRNPARSTDPAATIPGARSLVVGASGYLRMPPSSVGRAPLARVARYAWSDTYAPLRTGLGAVAQHLLGLGYRARVVADDNALVDREAAVRAGIGWYGKSTNVLLPGRGSWFVLGSVITDAALDPAPQPVPDGCGRCTRCIDACPTGAIVAPGRVDARRCLAWLVQAPGVFPVEFRAALGDRMYGCDDCQEVCPPNRAVGRAGEATGDASDARSVVSIVDLLALDDEQLLAAAGSWYVPERNARYLRRNALVVLANSADGSDPAVEAALIAALGHADPIVRGHAVWAANRVGRSDLLDGLWVTELHSEVLAELIGTA